MLRAVPLAPPPPCRLGPFPTPSLVGLRAILLCFSVLTSYLCRGCQSIGTLSSIPRAQRGPSGSSLAQRTQDIPAVAQPFPRRVGVSPTLCWLGRGEGLLHLRPWVRIWDLTAFLCSTSLLSTANLGACKAGLGSGLVMASTDPAV